MIFISIAHSSKACGAVNTELDVVEYKVSCIASESCFNMMKGNGIQCAMIDIGYVGDSEYSEKKTKIINEIMPDLALEIHCNSSPDKNAHYGECLYHFDCRASKKAADYVMNTIGDGIAKSLNPLIYENRGSQPNSPDYPLFFLDKTKCPAIIVEGFFISNNEHAQWLKNGGAEAYGTLVGEGLVKWFNERHN